MKTVLDMKTTPEWSEVTRVAQQETLNEHRLTVWQAIKTEWRAAFWSNVLSMAIVMQGYDQSLIGSFYAYPSFQKKYGTYYPKVGYQLSAPWQSALKDGAIIGIIFGALLNGYLSAIYGYKRAAMLGALVAMSLFIFIPFSPRRYQCCWLARSFVVYHGGCFSLLRLLMRQKSVPLCFVACSLVISTCGTSLASCSLQEFWMAL